MPPASSPHASPLTAPGLTDGAPDRLFECAARLALRCIGVEWAQVAVFDPATDRTRAKAEASIGESVPGGGHERLAALLGRHAIQQRAAVLVSDASHDPLVGALALATAPPTGACLGMPVLGTADAPLGALCALSAQPREWNATDVAIAEDLAVCIAHVIENRLDHRAHERRLQAAEAGIRAASDLVADVSHELRTPLNALLGMVSVLELTELSQRQREAVEVMASAGAQLRDLADDLLGVAELEAGGRGLDIGRFQPAALARNAIALVVASGAEGAERIGMDNPAGPEAAVFGDSRRITQVLINLLTNALDFAPGATIRIATARGPAAPDGTAALCFRVIDSGPGVPDDSKATVFERFRTSAKGQDRKAAGAGLGLAIARRLCERHGGSLSVEDTQGGGATFVACFRVQPDDLQ